jgi:tRNA A-37 threonylcarbamoyl transferase component Bud32
MGSIWVVEQLSTSKLRALKLLHADMTGEDSRRRFEQEARIGARIASEHVVEVIAAGVEDDRPWLVMELLEGEVLSGRVERSGALPVLVAADVMNQLAHGLSAAHDKQVVHRDLKPENIFLTASRLADRAVLVKILDFGIAKITEASVTATGAMGTPLWMAPEQTDHAGRVTLATDVWAFGLIAFYVLTGRCYWRSASAPDVTPAKVMRELLIEPLATASARAVEVGGTEVPIGFDPWFSRCVTREAGARFAHVRDAWSALAPLLGKEPSVRELPVASTTVRTADDAYGEGATLVGPAASSGRRLPTGAAVTLSGRDPSRPRARAALAVAAMVVVVAAVGLGLVVRGRAHENKSENEARPLPSPAASAPAATTATTPSAASAVEPREAPATEARAADAGLPSASAASGARAPSPPLRSGSGRRAPTPASASAPRPLPAPAAKPPPATRPVLL